jgi:hypothetical protein
LYYPLLVKESLLSSETPAWTWYNNQTSIPEVERLRTLHATGGLQRLDNYDCIKAYATQFQTKGSLFLVTKNKTLSPPLLSDLEGPHATQKWICHEDRCDNSLESSDEVKRLWEQPETWMIQNMYISYCLSEPLPERCRVQLSLPLAFIVICVNALKAGCMLSMLLKLDEEMSDPPIMNIGDTVTSYLDRSDAHTKNMGLSGLHDLRRSSNMSHRWDTRPKEFKGQRRLRFRAASKTRWGLTCFLCVFLYSSFPAFTH